MDQDNKGVHIVYAAYGVVFILAAIVSAIIYGLVMMVGNIIVDNEYREWFGNVRSGTKMTDEEFEKYASGSRARYVLDKDTNSYVLKDLY